jgi:hypothetical protein
MSEWLLVPGMLRFKQKCNGTFAIVYTAQDIFRIVQQQSQNKILQCDIPLKYDVKWIILIVNIY